MITKMSILTFFTLIIIWFEKIKAIEHRKISNYNNKTITFSYILSIYIKSNTTLIVFFYFYILKNGKTYKFNYLSNRILLFRRKWPLEHLFNIIFL